ncbi:RidA family protein [Planctomicrobium sp. SH664]|uniref:RidA family protein n=1 Tax=Planctomicrobium sp. SH664 TaxID=3448125 RepID=UPI003F5B3155
MSVEATLEKLGYQLPEAAKPVAAYVPCVRTGNLIYVSGQLPRTAGGMLAVGPVPSQVSIEQAQEAAVQCVLHGLAVLKAELNGDLSRVRRVVRLGVFVQSDSGFGDQPIVGNGASEFVEKIFGESGKHARAAVGVNALPLNAAVEVEFIFEVE